MTNELTRPLTGAEERLWQEKLAALLVRQIALYTANESSSVPAAAARELLRGVLFFLLCRRNRRQAASRRMWGADTRRNARTVSASCFRSILRTSWRAGNAVRSGMPR